MGQTGKTAKVIHRVLLIIFHQNTPGKGWQDLGDGPEETPIYTFQQMGPTRKTAKVIHKVLLIIFSVLLQIHRKRKRVIKDFDLSKTLTCLESEFSSRFGNAINETIGSSDELVKIRQLTVLKSNIGF